MKVRKFSASTTREALRLVRDALGQDAVILSNRNVNGVIEILALAAEDMAEIEPTPAVSAAEKMQPERKVLSEDVLAALTGKRLADEAPKSIAKQEETVQEPVPGQAASLASALQNARQANEMQVTGMDFKHVMHELRSMRGMLESQLAEISWDSRQKREPFKSAVLREMLAVGFSASLARYLMDKLPANGNAKSGLDWAKTILTRNLIVTDNENEILEKGGVYALVGPTGVGKTTTTAKLAARCVMRHGPSKLALITTDGYRIGGYEQLRIYGKILGVMVHSVKDESDLRIALDELKGKHTVLIDTVGMSQRDKMVADQVAMLSSAGSQVKRLLCLNATSTGETLNEVVRAYQGGGLAGCIMTKLDEAATIGSVLDVIIRSRLNLYYMANGQRVPEDLHVANPHYLIDRAFKLKRETGAFQYQDEELPLVMANAVAAANERNLQGVSLG
ncbi:flagellar biosynthesis protein FlhF [Oxalobacteraceae bacterium R-40]|uniref:Flagellar biosynthesis protein FlhF n=1 Tax=Keguizhuia sedimenti TaxID=3064264 RepID=A0ABU1BPL4_9BURK|nr:flagellar biosynthesis protein FlhF [Oxalobacteraceae bacterium R-40]